MTVNQGESENTNVRVICRVRPPNALEKSKAQGDCVKLGKTTVTLTSQSEETFTFDAVYGPDSTQAGVFGDAALPLVHDILNG